MPTEFHRINKLRLQKKYFKAKLDCIHDVYYSQEFFFFLIIK